MTRHRAAVQFVAICVGLTLGAAGFAQDSKRAPAPPDAPKGSESTPSPFAPEATGGPDAFGYVFTDSTEPGGPVFNFVDISGTGTALGLSDDGEANVTLSFNFPYYGVNQTQVRVGNNGGLLLGTATGDVEFTNVCPLPSTAGSTAPRISVFWDDIDDETGNVYHQTFGSCPVTSGGSGQCWIVQWHNRPHFNNVGSATFQAVLYGTGNILFQYSDTDFGNGSFDAGASASIGIEDEGANPGYVLGYSCNQVSAVPNGRAILFSGVPAPNGASLVGESCAAPNGAIDPGEEVVASLCIRNAGPTATANLVGTLQATGGVENPGGPATFGAIAPGATACQSYVFNADLSLGCGATLTATLALQDGATAYPDAAFTFTTGALVTQTTTFSNAAAISIPSSGVATPYPSAIAVAGMPGTILDVNVGLASFDHTFPDDVGALVVSPAGTAFLFFDGAGGGTDAVNLDFTLDDEAAMILPTASVALASGTFRPAAQYADSPSAPAPPVSGRAAPVSTATFATMFDGQNPNGTWNLFVQDFVGGDGGDVSGGWSVTITSGSRVCCTGACTVTPPPNVTVPNAPGLCSATATYGRPVPSGICGLVTCTPPSGSSFPVGVTNVTCDPEAPGADALSTVTVQDVEPPALTCPADVFATAPPGALSWPVSFATPAATDNCSATTACVPASGDPFPIGTTTDVCTATDAGGNSATCDFDVNVTTGTLQGIPTASTLGLALFALLLAGAAFVALRRHG